MTGYFLRRFITLILALFATSILIFIVVRIIPGNPAHVILGINASPEALKSLERELGLNKPLVSQYWSWLEGLFVGNWGKSVHYDIGVVKLIAERITVSFPLAIFSMIFSMVVAIPIGVFAAYRFGSWTDFGMVIISQIGISIPAFWLGILLLMAFAVKLNLLPAGGFPGWEEPVQAARSLVLPVISLSVIRSAALVRMTRSATLDVLSENYVSTARSKGLREFTILFKHVLRNSFVSVLTLIGLQLGQLLAGAIIIENVFYLPGLGRLLLLSVEQRDLPVVQGIVLLVAVSIFIINFLVDLSYGYLDPRIRYD